jgi:hypothetical protein
MRMLPPSEISGFLHRVLTLPPVFLTLCSFGAIQSGCADADQEIVWSQLRKRFVNQFDHVCIACVFKTNRPHAVLNNYRAGFVLHVFIRTRLAGDSARS